MPDQQLPTDSNAGLPPEAIENLWRQMLIGGNEKRKRRRHLYGRWPSNPRCVQCHRPFAGIGGVVFRLVQKTERSTKNPRFCAGCHSFTSRHPGGAEIELTMLFVDVRGSTTIAEQMNAPEFSRLMNRFYETAINVLVQADAFIDKLVGDEVTALFIPGFAGVEHARKAVEAGEALLWSTGHGEPGGPWIPVGVGIHTGTAWVGSIAGASGAAADFTALGDNVNIAARLASSAGQGEVLISEAASIAAGMRGEGLETRRLELKGKSEPVAVKVLRI